MKKIESKQNPIFKKWAKLLDKRGRQQHGEFVAEGVNEIDKALAGGYELTSFAVVPEYLDEKGQKLKAQIYANNKEACVELSPACFDQLAVRQGGGGVLGVFRCREHGFEDKDYGKTSLFLVIENGEKPGNLGALLRTASASGVSAVFVLGSGVDLYNPNVIRSSLGAVFLLPIVVCSKSEFLQYCRSHGVQIFLASLEDRSKPYWEEDFRRSCAFVLGNEASGLETDWYSKDLPLVYIPMEGPLDSLNLSVSGALLLYEAKRQRQR